MGRKRNTFSKAIKQLKSTTIDEKLQVLNEIPTNSTSGVFSLVPGALTRVEIDPKNPTVPDYDTIDWDVDGGDGKDTSGLFDSNGDSRFIAPPGDNSYIQGPMAAMYYTWAYPWTTIGYIRESDRRMINLGRIDGKLGDWDGSSGNAGSGTGTFYSYGQLTTEQAQWFRDTQKKDNAGNAPESANYRAFYPGPPSNTPDAFGRYLCTITGTPKEEKPNEKTVAPLDLAANENHAAMAKRAREHGLSRERSEEMSEEELKDFLDKMDRLDADIEKYSKQQKDAEAEARRIAIEFGVDVALTLTGGWILKGVGKAISFGYKGIRAANRARQISKAAKLIKTADKIDDAAALRKAAQAYNKAEKARKAAQAAKKAEQAAKAAQKAAQRAKPGSMKSPYPKGYKGSRQTGKLTGRNVDGTPIKQIPKGQPGSSTSPFPKGYTGPQKTGPLTGKPIPKATPKTPPKTTPTPKTPTPKSPQSTSIKNGPLSKSQTPKKQPNGKFRESDLDIKGPNGKDTIAKNVKINGKWHRINRPGPNASAAETLAWERIEARVSNKVWQHYMKTGELKTSPIGNPISAILNVGQGPTVGAKKYGVPAAVGALAGGAAIGTGIRKGIEKLKKGNNRKKISEERRSSILKDLKKPVVIPETKQKSYKVSPGKKLNQKTDFQGMDKLIGDTKLEKTFKKPQDIWSQDWQGYNAKLSQDKKNTVLELIGDGKHAFDYMLRDSRSKNAEEMEKFWGLHPELYSYNFNGKKYKATRKEQVRGDYIVFLVDETGKKSSMLQSTLNEKMAEEEEKEMLDEYNKLNPKNEPIPYEKDPLFKKVSKSIRSVTDYKDKPARKGYPNEPPPKLGPDGFHPDYGKRYKYDKLDPVSAVAMRNAPTGNPEIDANVEKTAKKSK